MKKTITTAEITLEQVKDSDFGCRNCLWVGIECKDYAKYAPKVSLTGQPSCTNYMYCD